MPEDKGVKVKPLKPEGYTESLSGDWNEVPDWATRRINFLEEMLDLHDKQRCPKLDSNCTEVSGLSCRTVKHCYPYLCNGSCGHNEIWITDKAKKVLRDLGEL